MLGAFPRQGCSSTGEWVMVSARSAGADRLVQGEALAPCLGDADGAGAIFNPLLAELPWVGGCYRVG